MPGDLDWIRPTGTIHVGTLNTKGEMSGCTSTSGLAFKIPGRVGDSPILGAGNYVDNDVGTAGSTGRGEANLLTCASFMIVEWMRMGKTPRKPAWKPASGSPSGRCRGSGGRTASRISTYPFTPFTATAATAPPRSLKARSIRSTTATSAACSTARSLYKK